MSERAHITVNAGRELGKQDHYWRYIGYDECNYTYLDEGVELLKKFSALSDEPYYVRTHFLFCTGNCHGTYKFGSTNVYSEDENGRPIYDFSYFDLIIDTLLETGNKPFLELGFMPMDLVDRAYLHPVQEDYELYGQYKDKGWTCPPKDYDKWYDFIRAVMEHLVMRYTEEEVKTWYFELWNEPDIFYWSGTSAQYCRLFDYTEHAVHTVLKDAYFGGPAVTGIFEGSKSQEFFRYFLNHCRDGVNFCTGEKGTRLDFITFHVKGGGFTFQMHAKKEVPSVESLVHQVKMGLDLIEEYGYGDLEVVLSEADPDGWAAGGVYDNANMVFRNTEYYASYVASVYEKIERLGRERGMVVRPLAWAFFFPGERCFEGTRTFTTQGIDKAVFNLFKIYGRLGDRKIFFSSDHGETLEFVNQPNPRWQNKERYTGEGEKTDISGFAVKNAKGSLQILIYSHNNDRDKQEETEICLLAEGITSKYVTVEHYRIDRGHSNAYTQWLKQKKPHFPKKEVYQRIKERDGLEKYTDDVRMEVKDDGIELSFSMPAHGVSYVVITPFS